MSFQVTEARGDLEKANRNATTKELDLKKALDTKHHHMEEQMADLTLQHNKHLEELIEHHSNELKKLEAFKDKEMKVFHFFSMGEQVEFCKSCNLIGSGC